MSENKEPKVTNPKFYEIIDGAVPFCPNYRTKFVEAVAVNYDSIYTRNESQYLII